ncbi:MAG: VOC family protein [Anaerolineales bacterium]
MVTPTPTTETTTEIHPATRLGAVDYTVADLGRQSNFYQERLGFELHWREGRSAGLGAGDHDLLRLTEMPGARPVRGTTGLYHTAFLFPTRLALAQVIRNIAETRTPVQGGSNHGAHLALYLDDAEGNGIELAWDFPREVWAPLMAKMRQGDVEALLRTMRQPLDIEALLAEAQSAPTAWTGLPAGSRVGHVHLYVADLEATARFYHDVLGFGTVFNLPEMGAAFFSAGGYHHHIGANTWRGVGLPPAPPEATGLRYFTIVMPNQDELDRLLERLKQAGLSQAPSADGLLVRDPAQIGIRLVADSVAG